MSSADDHVNVEQPVPENRDRHHGRDPEQDDDRHNRVGNGFHCFAIPTGHDGQQTDHLVSQHRHGGQR
jgi:hypothetical protein